MNPIFYVVHVSLTSTFEGGGSMHAVRSVAVDKGAKVQGNHGNTEVTESHISALLSGRCYPYQLNPRSKDERQCGE